MTVYYSIVNSHLQYAVTSRCNCSATGNGYKLNKAQSFTNKAQIINKFRLYQTRLKPLFEKINFLNISAIYVLQVGKFMAKLQNKQLPDYFSSLFSRSGVANLLIPCANIFHP